MMETTNQPPVGGGGGGHVIQSRTTSTSHGLRSSSSRRSRRYMQIDDGGSASAERLSVRDDYSTTSARGSSRNNNNSSTDFDSSQDLHPATTPRINDRMDDNGRCRTHPGIELCRRENNVWRVLLQDCPLCSMAAPPDGGMTTSSTSGKTKRRGGESSLKTDTTSPLSEEEEKSWTVSDASSEEEEDGGGGDNAKSQNPRRIVQNSMNREQQQQQQQPPPPPRQLNQGDEKKSRKKSHNPNNVNVSTLKELGKKLAAENANSNTPNANNTASFQRSSRNRNPPPPPRRSDRDLRSLSTKELSELRRSRTSTRNNIDEASDLISKMNARQQHQQQQQHNRGMKREETEAILGAAAEVRARIRGNNNHHHHHAERRSLLHQENVEIPYNDAIGTGRRGRARGGGEDILGAAEEIRNRARRSLSRSRERVKAASLFCGETPTDYGDDQSRGGDDGNETVATSASKRSILNPHGLSVAPSAPAVERRSQSRGKERGYAPESNDDHRNQANTMGRISPAPSTEHRPRSRNRRATNDSISGDTNISSSAQALIARRREMRERIAERQSNAAEKRHNRSNNDLDGSDKMVVNDLANAMLHEWSDVATGSNSTRERRSSREKDGGNRGGGGRRGRSRSVVRDGLSKIRSASLSAFRKSTSSHSVISGYDDANTVDTGRKSTASSIFAMMKKHGRSLSRGRSVASEFDARSDCRSESFALGGGAFNSNSDDNKSRSSIMSRFSMKAKESRRSRSRGKSNSFHRETQSDFNCGVNNQDVWGNEVEGFARSTLTRRLSKSSPSHGMVRSLSRNNSMSEGMNEHNTTKSESFALNQGTPWYEEDSLDIHSRFKKKSPQSSNLFD